ncbi:MAG: sensor histidine kinase [Deltaproteobacteria bacterium]|nr:sensor histidine kinase [Deltaproteobacteria bacterium]
MSTVTLRSPTTIFLHRARMIFMLTALIPTVMMTVIGIVLVAAGSKSLTVVGGILLLAFCATALVGYILGTIFVTRGASLAAIQNEFLASVSHELRTPLTSIRMFIDTLREERVHDPAEKQRCLTVIHQELARLDGLVGKLFTLSKIESRHAAFDRRHIAVSDVIDEALVAFEAIRFGTDIDFSVSVEPGLTVYGDQSALAQAVANLLGNAWKYTPAEGKKIAIAATADATHVSIVVTDNGFGIPRTEQEIIFEKFQRGSAALSSESVGTGLGLAVVRAIVKAHRGKVDVRSEVSEGARFRITLPRSRAEAA